MNNSDIEKELEEMYSQMMSRVCGMTLEKAQELTRMGIQVSKKQALKEGTNNLPENYGDLLLREAVNGNSNSRKIVDRARKEKATDDDIREFWNLNDLQRRMVFWSEDIFRFASFETFKKEGLNSDEAMIKVRKMFPMYGDPNNEKHVSGDDRPLPNELRGRVDEYRKKIGVINIEAKSKQYTTYNAFVRSEIREGNL